MSKTDAMKIVLDFLTKSNRPYSLNDVVENCGKEFGKATVQNTLNALVQKDKVTMKTFGKHKIYFIKQTADNLLEHKRALQNCAQNLARSQMSLKNKQTQYHELETRLKTITKVRTLNSLEEENSTLLDEIRELNEKLRRHDANVAQAKLTPDDAKKIEKQYELVASAYRKRKRICNDMLYAIMEGYPKSKQALIDDIGVETDEAAGFQIEVKH